MTHSTIRVDSDVILLPQTIHSDKFLGSWAVHKVRNKVRYAVRVRNDESGEITDFCRVIGTEYVGRDKQNRRRYDFIEGEPLTREEVAHVMDVLRRDIYRAKVWQSPRLAQFNA